MGESTVRGHMNGFISAMYALTVERAAEWERFEAELIAVTGSKSAALAMAECAVVAAKAGVESPEQLAGMIRQAHVAGFELARIRHRLRALMSDIEDMEGL